MCRITDFEYTCEHHIQHVWSACRGKVKVTKDSNTPACRKLPSIYARLATKCGSCNRADAEKKLRRDLTETTKQSTAEEFETILSEQVKILATQIPTTNWCPLPSPVYTRKPSQKRMRTPRKTSLLRNEFRPGDVCLPKAWEDNVVSQVYEAVVDGWNFPWTAETKSLADELAEDAERRKEEIGDEEGGFGDENEDDGEVEENVEGEDDEGGEQEFGGEDEGEGKGEKEESAFGGPPEAIEEEVNGGSVKVRYRFRKTTRGCNTQVRHWEMVEVWV